MKENYSDITIVLDRSGSMECIRNDVIGGFNTFLDEQIKVPGDCTISLYQFDDIYETVYENLNIKSAPKLSKDTYVPRNSTALLDAIGKSINKTGQRLSNLQENNRPAKVIFVIQTDGAENASHEFDKNKIFDMIKHQRETYQWQFVFLGANQDAIATATSYGIAANSSLTFASNSIGTTNSYNSLSNNLRSYRMNTSDSCSFTKEDKEKQENELNKV